MAASVERNGIALQIEMGGANTLYLTKNPENIKHKLCWSILQYKKIWETMIFFFSSFFF